MKLATYQDGSRDGQLVVVSRDLSTAHFATSTATRLQQVLDDWNFLSPQLQDLYVTLNQGKARHAFAFEPQKCMAPLPRAFQWAEAHAYPGADAALRLQAGAGDDFQGPCQAAWFGAESWGIDFQAGLAAITGDVDMGASADQGLNGVRLLMLANSWALRELEAAEAALGAGLLQSRPSPAFSPVAVTPDELGEAWHRGRVHLTLQTTVNGKKLGLCEAGADMAFDFGQLIAHLAKTRRVRAGTVVGTGPVANLDTSKGACSLAARRAHEAQQDGQARTPYLVTGDTVRIEMKGRDGLSLFGRIEQRVTGPNEPIETPAADDADELADQPAGEAGAV
jgi:fumarylacetoacetate (FAA) hydrolase